MSTLLEDPGLRPADEAAPPRVPLVPVGDEAGDWHESRWRRWWEQWLAYQRSPASKPDPAGVKLRQVLRWWSQPVVFLLVPGLWLCILLFIANFSYYWVSVIDDAYITFRFSENLVKGYGLVFNPGGMRVEGYTNFTWMLAIAAAIKMGCDAMFSAKMLGAACGIGTMVVSWRFAAALRRREDVINLMAPLFLACNAHFANWAMMGLETLGQVFLVTYAFHRFHREMNDHRAWLLSPWLATLAAMTRIDSLWYLSPLGVYGLWLVLQRRVRLLRMITWGAIAAITFGSYFGWKVSYFGDLAPNTFYAKKPWDDQRTRGKAHLYEFYLNQAGWEGTDTAPPSLTVPGPDGPQPLPEGTDRDRVMHANLTYWLRWGGNHNLAWLNLWLATLLAVLFARRSRVYFCIIVPILMQTYYIYHVDGDWMQGFRFFQIVLPAWAVGIPVAVGVLQNWIGRRRWWLTYPVYLYFAAALTGNAFEQFRINSVYIFAKDPLWMARDPNWADWDTIRGQFHKGFGAPLGPISDWMLRNTQDGATVLMSDIGQPMWFCEHLKLIDVDGLTDKYMADAPSVRGDLPSEKDVFAQVIAERSPGGPPKPGDLPALRMEARRRYQDSVYERNRRYVAEQVKPEYVVAFILHPDGNTSVNGLVYPENVRRFFVTPEFQEKYIEQEHMLKTTGSWNHVFRRRDVPATVPGDVKIARLRRAIEKNRWFPMLIPDLYEEMRRQQIKPDAPFWKLVEEGVRRFSADGSYIARVSQIARDERNIELSDRILEESLRANPRQPELYRARADLYASSGDYTKAAEALRPALRLASESDNFQYYHMAYLLEKAGQPAKAMAMCKEALRRVPGDLRAWSDYASIAERAGMPEQALEGFQEYAKLSGASTPPFIRDGIQRLKNQLQYRERMKAGS